MNLREAVAKEIRDAAFPFHLIDHMESLRTADHILALCQADTVRREREAFVAGCEWFEANHNWAGDGEDPKAEAARRYKEET